MHPLTSAMFNRKAFEPIFSGLYYCCEGPTQADDFSNLGASGIRQTVSERRDNSKTSHAPIAVCLAS
jgi:hypothetical protein